MKVLPGFISERFEIGKDGKIFLTHHIARLRTYSPTLAISGLGGQTLDEHIADATCLL